MFIITGATGHIGNNVVRYLLKQGEQVKVLVRKMDESLQGLDIQYAIHQEFDDLFLDQEIHEQDVIIHCAAYIDLMNKKPLTTFRTNVGLTKRLVEIALRKKNRFIYLSSVDVIPKSKRGLIKEPLQIDEKKGKSYYKTSKAIATHFVLKSIQEGLNGMVLYPAAVVGIHDYKPSAAGREILHAVRHQFLFSLHGGYNFIDVEDVARAVYVAATSTVCDHIILSAHEITIKGLYMTLERLTKKPKWIIPLPIIIVRLAVLFSTKYSQMMISTIQENYHYDQQKMRDVLHIVPKPLDQTLYETIQWLNQHYLMK
jgi:dihydroflavonol-4-reductase